MASLLRSRPHIVRQGQRAFSTSGNRSVSLQWDKNDPQALADTLPAYPYGPTRWYKQSRHGLYGGQRIQVGNNVGETFEVKTRRTWHPSVFTRKLFSKSLNRRVQVRVTARTLRTIDKLGGLDEYLLGEKTARIKELGESGWWLRWAIMQTDSVKARFAAERARLGLPAAELVESTMEEATEAEAALAAEQGEMIEMDEAFQLEESPDLPPLKFRVGPRQHVMLTSLGWIRTRPSEEYRASKIVQAENEWKADRKRQLQEEWLPKQMEKYEAVLRANSPTIMAEAAKQQYEEEMALYEQELAYHKAATDAAAEAQEKVAEARARDPPASEEEIAKIMEDVPEVPDITKSELPQLVEYEVLSEEQIQDLLSLQRSKLNDRIKKIVKDQSALRLKVQQARKEKLALKKAEKRAMAQESSQATVEN